MKRYAFITLGLLAAFNACASPVQLSRSAFATALAPLTSVVETFEGYSSGFKPSPLQLANSVFQSYKPYVGTAPSFGPTQKLVDQTGEGAAVFSSLLPGTTVFGVDLFAIIGGNVVEMTVVGASATLVFQSRFSDLGGFFGVQDQQGLISVSFQILPLTGPGSLGNYAFDNVTTGAAAVPEPGSLALASAALLALLGAGRRRAGRAGPVFQGQ